MYGLKPVPSNKLKAADPSDVHCLVIKLQQHRSESFGPAPVLKGCYFFGCFLACACGFSLRRVPASWALKG